MRFRKPKQDQPASQASQVIPILTLAVVIVILALTLTRRGE